MSDFFMNQFSLQPPPPQYPIGPDSNFYEEFMEIFAILSLSPFTVFTGGLSKALFISLSISKLFCTQGCMGGGSGNK
jgi:hypothetical protein